MKITEIKKKIGLDGARKVSTTLTKANIPFEIVDSGEKYVPFRGGDTVAQGSHWYVEVKIKE